MDTRLSRLCYGVIAVLALVLAGCSAPKPAMGGAASTTNNSGNQVSATSPLGQLSEQITAAWSVIVVMPDGDKDGWYNDWTSSPIAQKWQTYYFDQLILWIDQHLSTIADRAHRVIGVSQPEVMGRFTSQRRVPSCSGRSLVSLGY